MQNQREADKQLASINEAHFCSVNISCSIDIGKAYNKCLLKIFYYCSFNYAKNKSLMVQDVHSKCMTIPVPMPLYNLNIIIGETYHARVVPRLSQ